MSDNKLYWNDSCWAVRIVFTVKNREVGNTTML